MYGIAFTLRNINQAVLAKESPGIDSLGVWVKLIVQKVRY